MARFILFYLWPVILVVGALFLWRWYGQKRQQSGLKPLLGSDLSYIMITIAALIATILAFAVAIFSSHTNVETPNYKPAHLENGTFVPESWK